MSITSSPPTTSPPGTPPPGDEVAAALCQLRSAIAVLVQAEPTRAQVPQLGQHLVDLQTGIDTLAGVAARWTQVFADAGGHEQAGSATLAAWLRQHLRLSRAEARRRAQAGRMLHAMPTIREALEAGQIGTGHVDAIAAGMRQLGPDVLGEFDDIVVQVARDCDADAVRHTIAKIADTLDPDAADTAYLYALERRDVNVTAVGDGYALSGFLDPETGAMFTTVLYAGAKPLDKHDDRTAGQRRVDALQDLCRTTLDHGLPTDRGLRPHLFVTVTADKLNTVTQTPTGRPAARFGGTGDDHEPAILTGFGPISDQLLSRLACDCAATPVIVDGPGPYPNVLDVARTSRLATLKQRQAIIVQQGGTCYNPGCDNTHLEIHHMVAWSAGGPTDLANLRGYCTRCHHLIHQGLLIVRPDPNSGWTHSTTNHQPLHDRRRRNHRLNHRLNHRYLHALIAGGRGYAHAELDRWHHGQPSQPPPTPP